MMPQITPRAAFDLLKTTYTEWSEDKASRLAAALAYYTAFSIAPLLLISIAVAGLVFGQEAAQGQLFGQIEGLLGAEGAAAIETAVAGSNDRSAGVLATIIGLATLLWSASNVFGQLQEALNTIWEVHPDPTAGIMATIKRRFLSMTMVLGIGFLLLVSLVLTAALGVVGNFFNNLIPGGAAVWQVVNFIVSFVVVMALFAAIYKVLPDATIKWNDVWVGAAVTALLFTVGKLLIGLYLGHASVGSTFGAAGSLLVFLVWVYYSAQILFFGAEFTQVYARMYGSHIQPADGAIAMEEVVRADQGMPHSSAVEKAAADKGNGSGRKSDDQANADTRGKADGRGDGSKGGRQQGGRPQPERRESRDGKREPVGATGGGATDGRGGTNGHANAGGSDAHREPGVPASARLTKWNKKANQVGTDGKRQPNRPERPTEGQKASLKSLLPVGLAALGALWASRDDGKKGKKGK